MHSGRNKEESSSQEQEEKSRIRKSPRAEAQGGSSLLSANFSFHLFIEHVHDIKIHLWATSGPLPWPTQNHWWAEDCGLPVILHQQNQDIHPSRYPATIGLLHSIFQIRRVYSGLDLQEEHEQAVSTQQAAIEAMILHKALHGAADWSFQASAGRLHKNTSAFFLTTCCRISSAGFSTALELQIISTLLAHFSAHPFGYVRNQEPQSSLSTRLPLISLGVQKVAHKKRATSPAAEIQKLCGV